MSKEVFQPEIKDLLDCLKRIKALNKETVFIGTIVSFQDKKHSVIKENGSVVFANGDLTELRDLSNHIRDRIEDNVDDEDNVLI